MVNGVGMLMAAYWGLLRVGRCEGLGERMDAAVGDRELVGIIVVDATGFVHG